MSWLCKLHFHKYRYNIIDDTRVKCVCIRCGYGWIWRPHKSIIEMIKKKIKE